jgi:hypothetical protein
MSLSGSNREIGWPNHHFRFAPHGDDRPITPYAVAQIGLHETERLAHAGHDDHSIATKNCDNPSTTRVSPKHSAEQAVFVDKKAFRARCAPPRNE